MHVGAYRAQNENRERISPQAQKSNKVCIWATHVLKQEVIGQWHQTWITIDYTCCCIHKADIKGPGRLAVRVFLDEVSCHVSQWSKHKYQCGGDPDKAISNMSKIEN